MSTNHQADTSRLALVATAGPSRRQPPETIDTVRFLQAVTASLELEEVLGALNEFLHQAFGHGGWEYRGPSDEPRLAGGHSDRHRIEYTLTLNGQDLGALKLMRGRRFSEDDQQRIEGLLALAAPAIRNALRFSHVNRQLERDPLTGLGNRRALTLQGEQWLADSVRHHHSLSMLVLDLDSFKAVNDTHGHPVGDRILCKVAETLMTVTRTADLCVRLGGDEFVVLLPETGLDAAQDCAERIRRALARQFVETESGRRVGISVSIGAATLRADMSLDQLYQHADAALYVAKQARERDPAVTTQAKPRAATQRPAGRPTMRKE
ncbi:GGDEF domain-containing protein [Allochromatium tepidum]|uniref:GGDEF domain-containing protein n=1 Tax=Allochromatium tepidum TaxID=553982 RepID=UPI001F46B567|nr:GGDEF domain-containing protein [Allochromatium tepidum]